MDYALQPHLYKNVSVYLWPWVWWQLFQIERWIKATGRMVLGGVARDGKVYVLHVADDPNASKPWSPRKSKLTPWNRVLVEHRDLVRLVTGIAFDPTRHGDQLMLAMRLLEWPLMNTCLGRNEPLRTAPPARAQPPPIHNTSPTSDYPGLDPGSRATSPDVLNKTPDQVRGNRIF